VSHLTLVAPSSPSTLRPALAHDIRNAMAVIELNIEMLERLAGPSGARAASAAHQLLMRVTVLCDDSLRENANECLVPRRTSLDIVETIHQVVDILRPITPASLKIKLPLDYRHMVLANPNDALRIVFNLAHNAVTLARLSGKITLVDFHLERVKALTLLRITDNGPAFHRRRACDCFAPHPEPIPAQRTGTVWSSPAILPSAMEGRFSSLKCQPVRSSF